MACQFLNGSGPRTTHRQMRTERVPQDVDAGLDVCSLGDPPHHDLNDLLR